MKRVRVYYDSEFTGLTKDTSLISIGLCTDNGDYFYAEFSDYDKSKIDPWLQEHVIDNLILTDTLTVTNISSYLNLRGDRNTKLMMAGRRDVIRYNLDQWLRCLCRFYATDEDPEDGKIQIYSDCYAYDWVLLCDLLSNGRREYPITPQYLDYIPIDLSTLMLYNNIDPDISRESFIGDGKKMSIMASEPFRQMSRNGDIKHNSLWDAFVIRECFKTIESN